MTAILPATSGRLRERRLCPFCGATKPRDSEHRSFSIRSDGRYVCHRCGAHGSIGGNAPTPVTPGPGSAVDELAAQHNAARELWSGARSLFDCEASQARDYLRTRGLDAMAVHGLDVGYVHRWPSPRIGPALAFAFRDQRGEVVAVQGRAVARNVSCAHPARGAKRLGVFTTTGAFGTRPIAVSEAPIDALSLHIAGLHAVATGGTQHPSWLPAALRQSKRVIIATDNDDPGEDFARRLRDALRAAGVVPSRIIRLRPNCKDANADLLADEEAFRAQVRMAAGDPGP